VHKVNFFETDLYPKDFSLKTPVINQLETASESQYQKDDKTLNIRVIFRPLIMGAKEYTISKTYSRIQEKNYFLISEETFSVHDEDLRLIAADIPERDINSRIKKLFIQLTGAIIIPTEYKFTKDHG
jgi:hypothetical protein